MKNIIRKTIVLILFYTILVITFIAVVNVVNSISDNVENSEYYLNRN